MSKSLKNFTTIRTALENQWTARGLRIVFLLGGWKERIEVTDDSFLVERLGVEVIAVEGSARNIKITNQEDLILAEAILKQMSDARC